VPFNQTALRGGEGDDHAGVEELQPGGAEVRLHEGCQFDIVATSFALSRHAL
jgi:hypothetical protein